MFKNRIYYDEYILLGPIFINEQIHNVFSIMKHYPID
jgi:hypothetical protein